VVPIVTPPDVSAFYHLLAMDDYGQLADQLLEVPID
jgi:hypothetical protein